MAMQHHAQITWSGEQVRRGLPAATETIDPAWFKDAAPAKDEGWSLVCRFDSPPRDQGNPSLAQVRFLVDEAPHDRLRPGILLRLFERGTREYASVEILD